MSSSKAPPAGKLFPCPSCGAKIEFDPASRSLKCPFCGHASEIAAPVQEEESQVVEHDFEEYLAKVESGQEAGGIAGRSSQAKCSGCGAIVLLDEKVASEKCPFCGTFLENKPESAAGMIPPESLAPFHLDLRAARGAFEAWLGQLWFAPSELHKLANLGQLAGVYVPYWTYDAQTHTKYRGERGDDYTRTESYITTDAEGKSVTATRTVVETEWTAVSGLVEQFFDDILICATRSLPENLVSHLAWDLEKLEPFKVEFLSGFKTERYGIGLREGFGLAKKQMEPEIVELVRGDIGGDHQRIASARTQYSEVSFKHTLLPIWVASYRYQEKLYQILVNGRTGVVSGERPISTWKIVRLILLILAAFILLGVVMSRGK